MRKPPTRTGARAVAETFVSEMVSHRQATTAERWLTEALTVSEGERTVRSTVGAQPPPELAPGREATMKDVRCMLGWHAFQRRQVEDSQFMECRRCGQDRPPPGSKSGLTLK